MKFVYHNLKMLMNRTRYNGWVLGELFVVFIVLWFLCDSIGCFTYTLTRPLGFCSTNMKWSIRASFIPTTSIVISYMAMQRVLNSDVIP